MATRPGKMTERITFQRQSRYSDGAGGTERQWENISTLPTVWAEVVAKSGKESMVSDRIAATFTTLFHIRNRDDLDETMRIVWRGSNYNIRGIRRAGFHPGFLTIEAERGVAQ